MHVLIIGGGVIGLMSALELSHAGCQVTLLDQQDFGQAASWAGAGILSTMYPWRYPAAVNALARHGKALYQQWQPLLLEQTGMDIEIHDCGMLILDEPDIQIGLNWSTKDNDSQQQAEHLTGDSLLQKIPRLNPEFKQGVYFPHLANIRNPRLLKTLIHYLSQQPNVQLIPHTKVEQFIQRDQKIHAVKDQNGKLWQADHYVLANGAWSGLLGQHIQQDLQIKPVQGQMILFKGEPNCLPHMIMYQGHYLIPRLDGHIVCGSSREEVGFDTKVNPVIVEYLKQCAFEILPELQQKPIIKTWAGLRPASPKGIPYTGKSQQFDNVWLNTGHFTNGLVMAPASARMLRELMLGQELSVGAEASQLNTN
jgi:glycine oxidase